MTRPACNHAIESMKRRPCPTCEGYEGCFDPDWDGVGEPPDCPACGGTGYLPPSLTATTAAEPASPLPDPNGQEPT